jgi:hypothetical protein
MLDKKLKHIPVQAFYTGRKPTIVDVYTSDNYLHNLRHHDNCQLEHIVKHYNTFVQSKFRARKTEQEMNVTTMT